MRSFAARALWLGLCLHLACAPARAPERSLRLVFAAPPDTLDPLRHREDLTRIVLANFYETLVAFGPGFELQPRLAVRWETPSETVWRLRLRAGVRFHDGRRFGPPDVLASLERARGPGANANAELRGITSARELDADTVELVTAGPEPLLLAALASLPIMPRDSSSEDVRAPNGTGPYRFVFASADRSLVEGRRFDEYWDARPAFAAFRIEAQPDEGLRLAAARAGADLVTPVPAGTVAPQAGPFRVLLHPTVISSFLLCRLAPLSGGRPAPLQDLRVRRALSLAIDRPRLVRQALAGEGEPSWQMLARGANGYVAEFEKGERDLAEARRLLESALGGAPLELQLLVTARRQAVGLELQRQWAELGVRTEVVPLSWNEIYERMRSGRAVLGLASMTLNTGDAAALFDPVLHSAGGPAGLGAENISGYQSASTDQLIQAATREMNPRKRNDLLGRLTRQALDDLPLIPLYVPSWSYAVRNDLEFRPRLDLTVLAADLHPRPSR